MTRMMRATTSGVIRAAESESRPALESVGVDLFGRSRSRSWSWENFADSDSDPDSQDNTPQQTVILAENTERLKEKESGSVEIKLSVI